MKKVFVVVLHFKGREFTRQCLLSLQQLETTGFSVKIVIIDNHSPQPIADFKPDFPNIVFLKNKKNLGFAEGNNVGLKLALEKQADYVLILNNDTTVDRNLLSELVRETKKDGKIGIIAPKIYFAPGYEYHQSRYKPSEQGRIFWYSGGKIDWQNVLCSHRGVDEVDKGQYDKQEETDFASGCAMFVKRKVFEKIGLFDKRYFLYLEDVDFCQRAKQAGFKIIYHPKAKVWHFNASSSQVGGALHDYYITRNRLLFGLKFAPLKTKFSLLKESLSLLKNGRQWQKVAVRDFYLAKFGRGSYKENSK